MTKSKATKAEKDEVKKEEEKAPFNWILVVVPTAIFIVILSAISSALNVNIAEWIVILLSVSIFVYMTRNFFLRGEKENVCWLF